MSIATWPLFLYPAKATQSRLSFSSARQSTNRHRPAAAEAINTTSTRTAHNAGNSVGKKPAVCSANFVCWSTTV